MTPNIDESDLVIVKKTSWRKLQEGDIITFNQEGNIVTHRIYKVITKEGEENYYITKGDNNAVEDSYEIIPNQIYGKVVIHIKKIGAIVYYIKTIKGMINIIIVVIIVFIYINYRDKKRNLRKHKRKKYEIKKLREKYDI
jgi:signal peptidase